MTAVGTLLAWLFCIAWSVALLQSCRFAGRPKVCNAVRQWCHVLMCCSPAFFDRIVDSPAERSM